MKVNQELSKTAALTIQRRMTPSNNLLGTDDYQPEDSTNLPGNSMKTNQWALEERENSSK